MTHPILKSAAKIVFLLLAFGATAGLFTGHIKEENFMLLATAAFSFYFANKGDSQKDDEAGGPPYLGK